MFFTLAQIVQLRLREVQKIQKKTQKESVLTETFV